MKEQRLATRAGYGEALCKLGKEHKNLVVLDADLGHATGSLKFQQCYPNRYIEAGIAEQNLIGMAVGLSKVGYVPFASSFAVFAAGRGFEIIRNAVAYAKANVKIVGSHSGITPAGDGGTHQCIEDIALMRSLPGMVVLSPCDYNQVQLLTKAAYEYQGPVYMRTSREPMPLITTLDDSVEIGKAQLLREGGDLCIISTGIMTPLSIEASRILAGKNIQASILNIHTIKPLDIASISEIVPKCHGRFLVCEEANRCGGLGEAIVYGLSGKIPFKMRHVCIEDRFGQSGLTKELLEEYGITSENIVKTAIELINGL